MSVTSELSKRQFKEFLAFLAIIKPNFWDFSLVQGHFRSRDNNYLSIVETHFGYLDQMDFAFWDILSVAKKLTDLAKAANITITTDHTSVVFSDGSRAISIETSDRDNSSNPFITPEEMNRIWYEQIDINNALLKETLQQIVVSRMYKISHKSHEPAIFLKHEDGNLNKGNLFIEHRKEYTREWEWVYKNTNPIDFLIPIKKGAVIEIPSLSYAFNKSDTLLEVYLCRDHRSVGIKQTSRVGTLPVVTYSKSSYLGEEDKMGLDASFK